LRRAQIAKGLDSTGKPVTGTQVWGSADDTFVHDSSVKMAQGGLILRSGSCTCPIGMSCPDFVDPSTGIAISENDCFLVYSPKGPTSPLTFTFSKNPKPGGLPFAFSISTGSDKMGFKQ